MNSIKKVIILGSGGLCIGQAGEFDYSGTQAIKALKEELIEVILVNPNIATVQTSQNLADKVYFLPITPSYVEQIIERERPDGILLTFGGQTALNCGIELDSKGILNKYNVLVLGTPISCILDTEDRERFSAHISAIGEKVAPSSTVYSITEAIAKANVLGFPVLIRSGYALGGWGSGFAEDESELSKILRQAFSHSHQVILDKSLKGWKEIEFEVVRDVFGNCITICSMENVDPLGIHTGDSIVVAPCQTLNLEVVNVLKNSAVKVVGTLGIIGECNIQFALNSVSNEYFVVEVNARLSRSSALASKATGYPLAYIAAKLALGLSLTSIKNTINKITTAYFEPQIDYCVVKIPRWDLKKFSYVNTKIGSSMKSVGEVMGIGKNFEEALQKALRMMDENVLGFDPYIQSISEEELEFPTDKRIFVLAAALHQNYAIDHLHQLTHIDHWFLSKMKNIINVYKELENCIMKEWSYDLMLKAKQLGFCDKQLAFCLQNTEQNIRKKRRKLGIRPYVKKIDIFASHCSAETNYLYMTYNADHHDIQFSEISILVLGSGVYCIGSSVEFDCCAVGCLTELRKLGKRTIMLNCNPETVSTDYDVCNRLYFEEISSEINDLEKLEGCIICMGGQLPNNIAMTLYRQQVHILGTSPVNIDEAENRFKFSRMLDGIGISQPKWKELISVESAIQFCEDVGYPCLVRPSYVLSGAAMSVVYSEQDMESLLSKASNVSKEHPVIISKFIMDAKEIDVDIVAKEGKILCMGVSEHVENAGVHSGDATLITPPQDLNSETLSHITDICLAISMQLQVTGPMNLQLLAKDNKLQVIECNLRVSRSFPFVSKTLNYNFIETATRAIVLPEVETRNVIHGCGKVGVKVPQFSFSRLSGADATLGVEMMSTGEVACFGENMYTAYLKALLSTGFQIPKSSILLSIGTYKHKAELLPSVRALQKLGYDLFATFGTADFYSEHGIKITALEWPFGEIQENSTKVQMNSIAEYLASRKIDLMINLPTKNNSTCRFTSFITKGYLSRQMAIQYSIPLITDVKCAKLLIKALRMVDGEPKLNAYVDCQSSHKFIKLPGLIDIHTHIREPGNPYKEDWYSGTSAALSGGFTLICVMPNTNPPVTSIDTLMQVVDVAKEKSCCDFALFAGASETNASILKECSPLVVGMKMYLNPTFSHLNLSSMEIWMEHLKNWPFNSPVCVHAEGITMAAVLFLCKMLKRSIHICHVSTKEEIEIIRSAKQMGENVSCEVCPHHLFLTDNDIQKLGFNRSKVCPKLNTYEDQKALWNNLEFIDCFATDHAPHILSEKDSDNPPPGFPGLETILPLLLTAVKLQRLTLSDIVKRLYDNPRRIFNIPEQPNTHIEIDLDDQWIIPDIMPFSKCRWTPFSGFAVTGRVRRVVIRGQLVYLDGKIMCEAGFGKNIKISAANSPNIDSKHEILLNSFKPSIPEQFKMESKMEFAPRIKEFDLRISHLQFKHFITASDLTKENLAGIFSLAHYYNVCVEKEKPIHKLLKGKILASIFYEVSTRTNCSFKAAMQRLGGSVIELDTNNSSINKGETLEDTVIMMASYSDIVILRHPEVNILSRIKHLCQKPLINAGDGTGEHPTQALLDIYTIREEIGTVNGLVITMVGDLKHGRTVHSLAKLLTLYRVTLWYVAPEGLSMPNDIRQYVSSQDIVQEDHFSLEEVLPHTDVLYMTRIQKERFTSCEEYKKCCGKFILTSHLMTKAKAKMVVLHPLPRNFEISTEVDCDPRAAYFRQAENGMFIRMALLSILLGKI